MYSETVQLTSCPKVFQRGSIFMYCSVNLLGFCAIPTCLELRIVTKLRIGEHVRIQITVFNACQCCLPCAPSNPVSEHDSANTQLYWLDWCDKGWPLLPHLRSTYTLYMYTVARKWITVPTVPKLNPNYKKSGMVCKRIESLILALTFWIAVIPSLSTESLLCVGTS